MASIDIGLGSVIDTPLLSKLAEKVKEAHDILKKSPRRPDDTSGELYTALSITKEMGELVRKSKEQCFTLSTDITSEEIINCIQDVENADGVGLSGMSDNIVEYCNDGKIHHEFGKHNPGEYFWSDAERELLVALENRALLGPDAYDDEDIIDIDSTKRRDV